jgi:hypothetical protein
VGCPYLLFSHGALLLSLAFLLCTYPQRSGSIATSLSST